MKFLSSNSFKPRVNQTLVLFVQVRTALIGPTHLLKLIWVELSFLTRLVKINRFHHLRFSDFPHTLLFEVENFWLEQSVLKHLLFFGGDVIPLYKELFVLAFIHAVGGPEG